MKRADDLTELVALYWKFNPGKPLTKQMKIGLGRALLRFDAYGLAKYNRDGAVKLRDILFLTHAKPEGETQEVLFKKQLAENALPTPTLGRPSCRPARTSVRPSPACSMRASWATSPCCATCAT